jgi:hypothetical protein
VLPDGDEIADHEIAEHAEAEQIMKSIEQTDANDPELGRLATELIADTCHPLRDEETDLLQRLRRM